MKINEVIELLKADPESTLKSLDENNIGKILKHLSNKYYNQGISLVSDQLFDLVVDYYSTNFGKKYDKIGADVSVSAFNKVNLPYWMGSLDKIKPSTDIFNRWINKFSGPYLISYKLDGVSALLYKSNGKTYLYTRGNGKIGVDISHCIELIGINTMKLIEGDAIRGELIISKENFKKITGMANARNAVAGIIKKKNPNLKLLKLIDFVAYWVLSPQLKISEQLKYIEKKNFVPRCVDYLIENNISTEYLSNLMTDARESYKYDIDGIVVIDDSRFYPLETDSNPSYGFAFKQILTDQIAESTVTDVIWQISKDGYIKPTISIEPVNLCGVTITNATANNAKFIVDNVIGPGAIVTIIRSGDVIPKIEQVIKPADSAKPKMPNVKYVWTDSNVDIIGINLNDESKNKIITKKLSFFFSNLNIKWMGETTIEKFVANGYNDLWKILQANPTDLAKIEGFGQTIVTKLYQSINEGLSNRHLYEIMASSQIFGRGIGTKKFKLICDSYENILDIYKTNGPAHTQELINNIVGFDTKTTSKIIDNMDDFIIYLDKLLSIKPNVIYSNSIQSNLTQSNSTQSNSTQYNFEKFIGKKIIFTGFRDKDLQTLMEKFKVNFSNSVSKKTDFVIAENPSESSNKINDAIKLNVPILSKIEFYNLIGKIS